MRGQNLYFLLRNSGFSLLFIWRVTTERSILTYCSSCHATSEPEERKCRPSFFSPSEVSHSIPFFPHPHRSASLWGGMLPRKGPIHPSICRRADGAKKGIAFLFAQSDFTQVLGLKSGIEILFLRFAATFPEKSSWKAGGSRRFHQRTSYPDSRASPQKDPMRMNPK